MKKLISLISLLFLLQVLFSHAANIDTSFEFSTIETEHFAIHFHQGLEDAAQKAASIAEDMHESLVKEFKWSPREKTQMVLIDDSDFTNGFASVLPYNTIYIQLVPPAIDMTIGEYEDWLKILIIHEYSHILTIDPARGYSKIMRSIFGKPIPSGDPLSLLLFIVAGPPNIFLPLWWHEGIATWSETEYTRTGRGRGTFYEMILRMAVAENNIPAIDKINGDPPYWPDGNMPYIFGLRLQKYIADKYGKDALGDLNITHAGRFPYFLNGAPGGLFKGKNYVSLYWEMIEDLKREEKKRIEILSQAPFTPLKTLNIEGELLTNPRYSPDGSMIAFNKRDPHGHEAIMIAERDGGGARETVRRLASDHSISWSPDGIHIYFSQAEINRGFNIYHDLYSYDIKREKLKRLTYGLRIKEPDVSPDGKRIAVIVSERGSQNLAILDLKAEEHPSDGDDYRLEKVTNHRLVRVSGPRWSPEGRFIAYSVTDNNGRSGLYIYDTSEKTNRQIFEAAFNIAYPTWSKDGKYVIYTSDETGVYNIFAYSVNTHGQARRYLPSEQGEREGEAPKAWPLEGATQAPMMIEEHRRYQVTHLLGGAFQPDISSDSREIIFSGYDSKGFKIARIRYDPDKWMTTFGPTIKPYWKDDNESFKPLVSDLQEDDGLPNNRSFKPYSSAKTLLPKFWLPTLSGDHDGPVFGLFTAGQDVLAYNTYLLEFDYGASSNRVYYNAVYLNDYAYPTFTVRTYSSPVLYSDFLQRGDYFEINRSFVIGMSVPLNYLESRYRFIIGYHLQKQEALSDLTNSQFNGVAVFQGRRDNIFAGIEFSNSLKYPYSISHEEGRRISLLFRYYSRDIGSDLDSKEYIASYSEYLLLPFSGPIMRHNVIYLNLKGAISEGERINQQAFQLGGIPMQTEFPLRGYPSRFSTGQYIATGTLEYRAPIWYILRGRNTKPFFLDRLHGALFTDLGEAWDNNIGFSSERLKIGAGIEVRFDMTLGYWLKITPTLGFAHGFNQDGETSVYFTIYSNL